jgi:DNA-directed RNA polymerase specialized sigma24 family protein
MQTGRSAPCVVMAAGVTMNAEVGWRAAFTDFVSATQDRLRYALVAAYGPERGLEAAADALAYAWEHWDRIREMENPGGYVYRVGQNVAIRRRRSRSIGFPAVPTSLPWVEPGLPAALETLTERQRVVVVLVHGFGYRHREVAEVLDISTSTVQRHLERGLEKLRSSLGVDGHA